MKADGDDEHSRRSETLCLRYQQHGNILFSTGYGYVFLINLLTHSKWAWLIDLLRDLGCLLLSTMILSALTSSEAVNSSDAAIDFLEMRVVPSFRTFKRDASESWHVKMLEARAFGNNGQHRLNDKLEPFSFTLSSDSPSVTSRTMPSITSDD